MADWDYRLNLADIFHSDDLTTLEKANLIADRIEGSEWFDDVNYYGTLEDLCHQLRECPEDSLFNWYWNGLYDVFDLYRVWVITR